MWHNRYTAMKKELFIHFAFLISFFIFISILRGWFNLSFLPLWLGGILGTILPDVDHFIYVYLLKPHELTSQRVLYMFSKKDYKGVFSLLADTRSERTKLIFHTAFFQGIFLILTFLVVTSSGSIFGRGLVLAFSLHLSVDQLVDFVELGNIDHWFESMKIKLDKEKTKLFLFGILAINLFLGFLM